MIHYELQKDAPHGNEVAYTSQEYKEMKHRVHVLAAVERVEEGAGDVSGALSYYPIEGAGRQAVDQRLQGHEYRKPHAHEAERLQIAVRLEVAEALHRAHDGAKPYEDKESPAPQSVLAQADERDGAVASRDVPVDGRMVPFAQPLLPHRPGRKRVVEGGGDVGAEHAEKVEDDARRGPSVPRLEAPHEEDDSERHAEGDARSVG